MPDFVNVKLLLVYMCIIGILKYIISFHFDNIFRSKRHADNQFWNKCNFSN